MEWRGGSKSPAVVDVSSTEFKKNPGLTLLDVHITKLRNILPTLVRLHQRKRQAYQVLAHHPQGLEGMEEWGAVRHCFA